MCHSVGEPKRVSRATSFEMSEPYGLSELPCDMCHSVGEPKRVSRATSFEMSFSKAVPDSTGVPVLRPSPRVGGCYIHPLSDTISVNDMHAHERANVSTEP